MSEGLDQYHPLDPLAAFDVHPKLDELRRSCPAFRATNENYPPVTLFTRYADVATVLRDHRTFRNMGTDVRAEDYERIPPDERVHIQLNPPEATEVRRLHLAAVAPAVVKRVAPRIEQLGNDVVTRFRSNGRAELVSEWASIIPGLATAYVLGFPEDDASQIHAWAVAQLSEQALQEREAKEGKPYSLQAMSGLFDEYLRSQLELRRNGTITADDGVSRMMQYEPKRGYPFSDDELVRHIASLIGAANETTTGLMSNAMYQILTTPGLFERLQTDRTLVDPVIEEVLRFKPPLVLVTRGCQRRTTIAGGDLEPGDGIVVSFSSANRDEAIWGDDAGEFKPDRFVNPPEHDVMTFGLGIHLCPGAHLARLETRIAMNALLDHTRNMRLAPDFTYKKVWLYLLDRPKDLRVEFEPAVSSAD